MDWTPFTILEISAIGLVGGTLGGLLGLGGSVFIIPALTFVFGANHHLYQASALVANVFVAAAATRKHRGRGTIRRDVVPTLATAASLAALVGVFTSNQIPTAGLSIAFGCFLCYASWNEFYSLARRTPDAAATPDAHAPRSIVCLAGVAGGFASGLLGIGGGAIMVPILRKYAKLPLRHAVASSAAAMIIACLIGAIAKNASLASVAEAATQQLTLSKSLSLAAILAPSAMVGGTIGATLVYRLPLGVIRFLLAALLVFAGYRMIATGLRAGQPRQEERTMPFESTAPASTPSSASNAGA
ncbi:MAG: sulfite exporter TauE/SafE family protein [Limnohabitans sp.]|nr:sulfite exporter TauE/SafE family protein [Limnohabitans sp.]